MTRKYTNLLMDAVEDGLLSPTAVMEMALSYMSESDVEDMMRVNDLLYYLEPEEDEEVDCDDSDDGYALASSGWGTDEDYGGYDD